MGGGAWKQDDFVSYSCNTRGISSSDIDYKTGSYTVRSHQDIFKSRTINEALNPFKVTRECCDSAEHPQTIPVILALDVTGSMGDAAKEVATKLNIIMTDLYSKVKDVEFMIMGIGDFAYDDAPLQVSQFESDIRIAEQMDKIWFEGCGGGNSYESYTGAWYFGTKHCKLDCWNRGRKGIIITLGDENLNPYIPYKKLAKATGDSLQGDVETKELYTEAAEKYDIFHIYVDHHGYQYADMNTWTDVLPKQHVMSCKIEDIPQAISDIVTSAVTEAESFIEVPKEGETNTNGGEGISW